MKNRLIPGLFSTISDAELFTATMGTEMSDEQQSPSAGPQESHLTNGETRKK